MCTWFIKVSQSPHIFHMEQFEDVIDTKAHLYVWFLAVHQEAGWTIIARREHKQIFVASLVGVILVGKCSPHGTHTEHLAPLQVLNERDTVEQA